MSLGGGLYGVLGGGVIMPKVVAATAFPQTAAPTETTVGVASTTHAVNMPATVNAGDLLFVGLGYMFPGGSVSAGTVTTPSGWTSLFDAATGGTTSNPQRLSGFVKVADGTEGGTTVNFDTSVNAVSAAHCYRVTDWFGDLAGVEVGTIAVSTDSTPNPPSVTPSWGSAETLWIAVTNMTDDSVAVTGYPANYTGGVHTTPGNADNANVGFASARRELEASSDDPGSFTLDENEGCRAQTIAIRPAA